MTWEEYFIVLGSCMVTMLACRVLPLFLLKGRSLPDAVERALAQLQITAEKQSAQGDAPEAFTDTVIMYEVLSELKEIAARPRGITCACGSERYRMQVRPAAVDLICEDCGAKLRIGAATDEDLDRLCCRMTLQIPGKKG